MVVPLLRSLFCLTHFYRMSSSSGGFAVRRAVISDLPAIHQLIKDSFNALNDYVPPEMHPRIIKAAESLCETELSPADFEKTYFSSVGTTFLVVEETACAEVHGCMAVKRITHDMAELVRMAVSPSKRSQGLGQLLINELVRYCAETGAIQIFLTTGNPRSGTFYAKHGFNNLYGPESRLMRMFRYLGERVIKRVALIGGTHGNERIGVELIRQWSDDAASISRPTFDVITLLGNPVAVDKNIRYVDKDMNRQFLGSKLSNSGETEEDRRAAEIDRLVGPKGLIVDERSEEHEHLPACDFVIDLHSSNSNVGLVAMISAADYDCVASRLAHYLLHDEQMKAQFPGLRVTSSTGDKGGSWSVDSVTPYGISFEVGPLVHGTLSSQLLEQTRQLVLATLDFIERQNQLLIEAANKGSGVAELPGRTVVLASASVEAEALICRKGPAPEFDCYVQIAKLEYPLADPVASVNPVPPAAAVAATDAARADGTGPSSLASPLKAHQRRSPYILHPSLEGRDWDAEAIADGQPAFMSTDGTLSFVPFTRPTIPWMGFGLPTGPNGTDGCTLYPLFINEAAYQESGVACALYKKVSKQVF